MLLTQRRMSVRQWIARVGRVAATCVLGACTDQGVGPARTVDVAVTDAHSDGVADVAVDPCDGLLCAGHGSCVALPAGPTCTCDPGFVAASPLTCVPVGQCPAGELHAAGVCVAPDALTAWCDDYCATLSMACPPGVSRPPECAPYCAQAETVGPGCVATCLGQLDAPGAVAQTLCGGLMRRVDSVQCRDLALCATPVHDPVCADVCDAVDACGLLHDRRLLFGSTRAECGLYCDALATALAPNARFTDLAQCALRATHTCDPLALLGCEVVGVPEIPATLCTTTAPACGFIPSLWPDTGACEVAIAAWSPGQQIAVAACLNVGGFGDQCAEHHCASPPDALPPGAETAALAMMQHCPGLLAVQADFAPAATFYAWFWVGILRAFGQSEDRDYAAIADCYLAQTCPTTKEGTLECLLHATKD